MLSEEHLSRVGGTSAIVGPVLLFVATMLHPMDAQPGNASAAFAEYALDRHWVATHLGQLLGVVLVASGFVALSWKLRAGRAGAWALLAGLSAVASVSLAGALQAVDGVALKFMVGRWAEAESSREVVFEAVFGVRQIEVGLASLLAMFFGLTVLLYGVALLLSPLGPRWLGVFGDGSYLLLNVPVGTHTVTVQRIGYRTVTVQLSVGAGETMAQNFQITEEALSLDEIIVTGTPGGTARRAIGNTVTTVDVSDIVQDVSISSMQDLLAGRTPGLQFARLSGNVGTGSPITIRGVGSFSFTRNQPLVYVDGVRVNNDPEAGPNIGSGDNASVLDDFNPGDIESIEIIKGPAAASLYGTEASAGVIQIITKKGNEGAPQFNFSIKQGTNYLKDPAGRLGEMWTCPTDPGPGPTDCQNEADLVPYNMYDEANRYIREGYFPWATENLYQNGLASSYNLDVRGGTQSIRYFLSANYDDEAGIVHYNNDETFRLRANVGVVFSDMFSLDVSTGFVDGYTRFAGPTRSDGGVWQDLLWSNGYYLDRVNSFDRSGANARLGGFQEHLPSDVNDVEATRDYTRFTGAATLNFNSGDFGWLGMNSSLTQRLVMGVDKGWDTNRQLFPLEAGPVPDSGSGFSVQNNNIL